MTICVLRPTIVAIIPSRDQTRSPRTTQTGNAANDTGLEMSDTRTHRRTRNPHPRHHPAHSTSLATNQPNRRSQRITLELTDASRE